MDKPSRLAWMREVDGYQWRVLAVATLGLAFDIMDTTLYALVQRPALTELLGAHATPVRLSTTNGFVIAATLAGWAIGGVVAGVASDAFGRVRAMMVTVLAYSFFTGLGAFAHSWSDLMACRFLAGIGLGGEWVVGAALIAEAWPERLRAKGAAIMVAGGRLGVLFAALVNLGVGARSWRYVFLAGGAPVVILAAIRWFVREPEPWLRAREVREARGEAALGRRSDLRALFSPELRTDTLVSCALAAVALLGLWGAGQWIPGAIREMLEPSLRGAPAAVREAQLARAASISAILLDVGGVVGSAAMGYLVDRIGRRRTVLLYLAAGAVLLPTMLLATRSIAEAYLLLPFVGLSVYGVLAFFAIYLPELFPSSLRATGVGFTFNVGRILTVIGVLGTAQLVRVAGSTTRALALVGLIYLVGIALLPWLRETRGRPLR